MHGADQHVLVMTAVLVEAAAALDLPYSPP